VILLDHCGTALLVTLVGSVYPASLVVFLVISELSGVILDSVKWGWFETNKGSHRCIDWRNWWYAIYLRQLFPSNRDQFYLPDLGVSAQRSVSTPIAKEFFSSNYSKACWCFSICSWVCSGSFSLGVDDSGGISSEGSIGFFLFPILSDSEYSFHFLFKLRPILSPSQQHLIKRSEIVHLGVVFSDW
jgi:hypothetical protein